MNRPFNFIIIHGAYGSPKENWIPWLKDELEKSKNHVFTPLFPTPQGQSLERWLDVLHSYDLFFDTDLILIGHSIGATFILKKLEIFDKPVKAVFLVAPLVDKINNTNFNSINSSFFETGFDWNKIKKNCKAFYVYHSDNDPYVPLAHGKKIADALGVKLNVVNGAGHFNEASGYKQFPLLLEDIKKEILKK